MHSLKTLVDRKRLRQAAALCGAVVACATVPAVAATPPAAPAAKPAQSVSPAQPASQAAPGMVIVRDAATGRLRAPTRDEAGEIGRKAASEARARAAARNVRRSGAVASDAIATDSSAVTFVTASGVRGARLDESSYAYAVVSRKADGTLAMGCVDGADQATKAVHDGVVAEDHAKESHDETK